MDLQNSGTQTEVTDPSLAGARNVAAETTPGFRGVAVAATNQDEIHTFTISLAGGMVGVAVSAGVDVVHANTEAFIGNNASVNASDASAAAAQSVLVGAGSDFHHLSVAGSLAVGYVAVAPAVGVNVIGNTTRAAIGDGATVRAKDDVRVEASASEDLVMVGFGLAGGFVGVGATVGVLDISNETTARIGAGAVVSAGSDVRVSAADNTHVFELSGALAGGFVGVGGSVGLMMVDKTTHASIGAGAQVDALGA